ncbi:MAG: hypothetical protein Q7J76_00200 [Candidatus Brocadiaceae bacterium]|nr:hypothetical protein [Candidatus Brocadiaceae bacterium]
MNGAFLLLPEILIIRKTLLSNTQRYKGMHGFRFQRGVASDR